MTDNFLWHEVSEKEKEEIKQQAKGIMNSFSEKLSNIDSKKFKDSFVEREEFERSENSKETNKINRKIMFENAPEKDDDFIIAERKRW